MLAESNDDKKSNTILLGVDFPNDPLSTNDILNGFDENVSQEPNPDDLKSNAVHHHLIISGGFFIQCAKYILIRVILVVTWRYEDPTLFRGGWG
ncbi:unnamed protein product [Schistosoma curassoni]|uniref:Uncharacterized protein n=1 Tax=Schistosoma curassoni TaxID=6186 RepID=A0A183KTM5_9TREM|nr:unnamed protein product [Schistosoma curassoni]